MQRRSFLLAPLLPMASMAAMAAMTTLAGCAGISQPRSAARSIMSPDFIVEALLDLAEVKQGDRLYDLGCGDGRIVIGAARRGATGVGVDIDPGQIRLANEAAARAGVTNGVRFLITDLFTLDIRDATVVTLYLSEETNVKLMPRLRSELRRGTRVVSHEFSMEGYWEPEKTIMVGGRALHRWIV
jgi:cyclopropane fatty-acyl-phospholipid synthase-like methyltransferase